MKIKSLFTIVLSATVAFAISGCQKQETVEFNNTSEETELVKISELTKSLGTEVNASAENVNAAIESIAAGIMMQTPEISEADSTATDFLKMLSSIFVKGENGYSIDPDALIQFIKALKDNEIITVGMINDGKTVRIETNDGYFLDANLPDSIFSMTFEFVIGKGDCKYATATVNMVDAEVTTKLFDSDQINVAGSYYKFSYVEKNDLKSLVLWYNNQLPGAENYRTNIQIKEVETISTAVQLMILGDCFTQTTANSVAEMFNSNITRVGGAGRAIINGNELYAVVAKDPDSILYGVCVKYGGFYIDMNDLYNEISKLMDSVSGQIVFVQ